VLGLQRLIGNQAVGRVLGQALIQRETSHWRNKDTSKMFDVAVREGGGPTVRVNEQADGGFLASLFGSGPKQHGAATYEKKGDAIVLHTISAFPEEGSGIGSLLMFLLAQDAVDQDAKVIEIEDPAVFAVGFYEHMGAVAQQPEGVEAREEMMRLKGKPKLWGEIVEHRTQAAHEKRYAERGHVPWEKLSDEQKKKLRAEKQAELEAGEGAEGRKDEAVEELVHGYAVSSLGAMKAEPATLLKSTHASVFKRWEHRA
jgi:hypothetical protein